MKKTNNRRGAIIIGMADKKEENQIGYDINEKDVDTIIRILKKYDPEHATPKYVIDFLTKTKFNMRESSNVDFGDNLIDLFNKYLKSL